MEQEKDLGESYHSIISLLHGPVSWKNQRVKTEVEQIILTIADKRSIPALIDLLDDNEYDVRWIAAESLIKIGRTSVIPLIRSIKNGKSSCFPGRGAYHVLENLLTKTEKRALQRIIAGSESR